MTTAPLETPINLFDIELEQMLDGEVVCMHHTESPAVVASTHVGCTAPLRLYCLPCEGHVRTNIAGAKAGRWQLHCNQCGARNIPPADITIRPI